MFRSTVFPADRSTFDPTGPSLGPNRSAAGLGALGSNGYSIRRGRGSAHRVSLLGFASARKNLSRDRIELCSSSSYPS